MTTAKYTSNTGDVNCYGDLVVQCGAHCPMEHTPGFNRSHWMLPLGECTHRIATVAVLVDNFGCKHQTPTKKLFSPSLPTSEESIVDQATFILTTDTLNVFFVIA